MDKTFKTYCKLVECCSLAKAVQHSVAIVRSVFPCVTCWHCDKTNPAEITWSSPLDILIILV